MANETFRLRACFDVNPPLTKRHVVDPVINCVKQAAISWNKDVDVETSEVVGTYVHYIQITINGVVIKGEGRVFLKAALAKLHGGEKNHFQEVV